ncbi:hypothetical protein [Variovorax sp. ZT4R33]
MATFVPPLTVVPVSLLLPSMRELRLLQRMLSDWPPPCLRLAAFF